MPLRTVKTDLTDALTLEWILHVKNYKLTVDKKRCTGCQICSLGCPKEAIRLDKQPRTAGEKARKAKIDVDLTKCNFCGVCDVLCPYGAIRITLNDKHALPVIEKQSFPELVRDIQVDATKWSPDVEYENVCPLDLIKASWCTPDGKPIENINSLSDEERKELKITIALQKEYCPCCTICESRLPQGVINVRKFVHGKIIVNSEKCPENCRDCLDVCPIDGALYLSDDGRKVRVNEAFCVYCGACKVVCPVVEALELKRTGISHVPLRSGTWNKALERLASPVEVTKELRAKGSERARDSVEKRLGYKVK